MVFLWPSGFLKYCDRPIPIFSFKKKLWKYFLHHFAKFDLTGTVDGAIILPSSAFQTKE
jgi:hypothetical protein